MNRALEGEPIDLPAAADTLVIEQATHDRDQLALRVLQEATTVAGDRVANIARDVADSIIVDHLRPRYDATMTQAAELVPALVGVPLTVKALVSGSAKVRQAWRAMRDLGDTRSLLLTARRHANSAGERRPAQDGRNEFSSFKKPAALFPELPERSRLPQDWPVPEEPVARMLWLLTDARTAEPWLPTVAEQDQAYDAVYGGANRMRANAAHFAQGSGRDSKRRDRER